MPSKICLIIIVAIVATTGCQTFQTPWNKKPLAADLSAESTEVRDDRDSATVVADYLTGKGSTNKEKARAQYLKGEELFRLASQSENDDRKGTFRKAAASYRSAAKEWPKSAMEEDALMMAGECYFFADDLPKSDAIYGEVLENHPRSRHIDRIVSRRFEIAKYWLAVHETKSSIIPVNFTDRSLPVVDTDGTGIKLLDQIRYDDPTGKLADDATMAAGIEYFQREKWIIADGMFADLRETFPDSDHQFNAHLFGLKCKLEIYQGPKYSGNSLDEGEELIKKMTRRFPKDMQVEENRSLISKAAAEIEFLKAERFWHRAEFRLKKGENGSARFYFQKILEQYPKTPFADKSREALASIEGEPDSPPERLSWLKEFFPDGEAAKPLMVGSEKTILR